MPVGRGKWLGGWVDRARTRNCTRLVTENTRPMSVVEASNFSFIKRGKKGPLGRWVGGWVGSGWSGVGGWKWASSVLT